LLALIMVKVVHGKKLSCNKAKKEILVAKENIMIKVFFKNI